MEGVHGKETLINSILELEGGKRSLRFSSTINELALIDRGDAFLYRRAALINQSCPETDCALRRQKPGYA